MGGHSGSTADPNWKDIEKGLRELSQEADSYLILEQKDPQSPETCWFIQCAVAMQGPEQGHYSVEIGFSIPGSPSLWEQMVPDVQKAIEFFSAAYYHRGMDISGFEKMKL